MTEFRRYNKLYGLQEGSKASDFLSVLALSFLGYAGLRAGSRIIGYTLPGQCSNAMIANPFVDWFLGNCAPVLTWVSTRVAQWNSAHVWAWLIICAVGLFASFYPKHNGRFSWDGVRGFVLVAFMVAYHELHWYVVYFTVHNYLGWEAIRGIIFYGPFLIFLIIIVCIYYRIPRIHVSKKPFKLDFWFEKSFYQDIDLKILPLLSIPWYVYLIGWATVGFPITLDLKYGITGWYAVGIADLVELASWLLVAFAVVMAYYVKALKTASNRIL